MTAFLPVENSRPFEFSVLDHLLVQREIEKRAYALWLAEGNRPSSRLSDWLRAECEVVTRFCQAYEEGLKELRQTHFRRGKDRAEGGLQMRRVHKRRSCTPTAGEPRISQ